MADIGDVLIARSRSDNAIPHFFRREMLARVIKESWEAFDGNFHHADRGFVSACDDTYNEDFWPRVEWTWISRTSLRLAPYGPFVYEKFEDTPFFEVNVSDQNWHEVAELCMLLLAEADDSTQFTRWFYGPVDVLDQVLQPDCDDTIRLAADYNGETLAHIQKRGINFHTDMAIPAWLSPWLEEAL